MEMHGKTSPRRHAMTLSVIVCICTDHSKGNPRLSDVVDLERFPGSHSSSFKTIGSYTNLDFYNAIIHSRRVPVTAVTALRTPNSDWRQVASSSITVRQR
jgi:hypothetical protein